MDFYSDPEMFGPLDNFITYGSETIAQNEEYRRMLADMYQTGMTSTHLGVQDRIIACKLAETMMLNLRGHIDSVRGLFFPPEMLCNGTGAYFHLS
jgi:hypothetical protein